MPFWSSSVCKVSKKSQYFKFHGLRVRLSEALSTTAWWFLKCKCKMLSVSIPFPYVSIKGAFCKCHHLIVQVASRCQCCCVNNITKGEIQSSLAWSNIPITHSHKMLCNTWAQSDLLLCYNQQEQLSVLFVWSWSLSLRQYYMPTNIKCTQVSFKWSSVKRVFDVFCYNKKMQNTWSASYRKLICDIIFYVTISR